MTIVGTSVPYYLEAGFGERVVLMLHGIGGGHQSFSGQMQVLANHGWRAIAWDMPGYGYSRSVEPYTMAALAEACLDLIEVIDAREVVLLGHSMGGMVAQEVAARSPGSLAGLVLASTTAAFGRADGQWQREFLAARTALLDAGQSMAELAAGLVADMVAPGTGAAVIESAKASMAAVPSTTYRHALGALMQFDRRAELASLSMPALVIAGAEDRTAPATVMEKMAARIPKARYAVLANAGHLLNIEQPEAFNRTLLGFLSETFPGGQPR